MPHFDFDGETPFFAANMKRIVIAIDGFSSTGKSSLARQLAEKLGYIYVDSGAMYRAITLYFLDHEIDLSESKAVENALHHIRLAFVQNQICLNGVCVEADIREMRISNFVSQVSAIEAVRHFAVAQQQKMGEAKGIVMDGRDIGTAVFPDAELKIYLRAEDEVRTRRRFEELQEKKSTVSLEEVRANLKHRDHLDSTREISPLRIAQDAVILDNTHLSFSETVDRAYELALLRIAQD